MYTLCMITQVIHELYKRFKNIGWDINLLKQGLTVLNKYTAGRYNPHPMPMYSHSHTWQAPLTSDNTRNN